MKKLFQKVIQGVIYRSHCYIVWFQVLNSPEDKILSENHNDIAYICDEKIMSKGLKPNGTWGIFGHNKDKTIDVPYDARNISSEQIKRFLEDYGFKVKEIKNKPMKRFGNFQF